MSVLASLDSPRWMLGLCRLPRGGLLHFRVAAKLRLHDFETCVTENKRQGVYV